MSGHLGKEYDWLFGQAMGQSASADPKHPRPRHCDEDLKLFLEWFRDEALFDYIPGSEHSGFNDLALLRLPITWLHWERKWISGGKEATKGPNVFNVNLNIPDKVSLHDRCPFIAGSLTRDDRIPFLHNVPCLKTGFTVVNIYLQWFHVKSSEKLCFYF